MRCSAGKCLWLARPPIVDLVTLVRGQSVDLRFGRTKLRARIRHHNVHRVGSQRAHRINPAADVPSDDTVSFSIAAPPSLMIALALDACPLITTTPPGTAFRRLDAGYTQIGGFGCSGT